MQIPSENGATPYAPTTKQDIRNKQKWMGALKLPQIQKIIQNNKS
ncbi:hypothetical protein BDCR2A_01735 [Borrelia duttonii CR2A]|uniref:Uncharacterized protein n=1 Tax=Borrelia duttonii CR2A TaxID=1432657 RepID=W6TF78_9SPIR|nr:hypothetical protein BDCR2A_01735 [Borrelia duttonii CR2A]